jgi:poly [ADP-ribose] polymerase 6/8
MGLGLNVLAELKDDPLAVDLVISFCSAAVGTAHLQPHPPQLTDAQIRAILAKLPSVQDMFKNCDSDHDLARRIGGDSFELLRWILFSNRSHLMSLPDEMRLPEFPGCLQFMTLISSPEAEETFNILKQQFGSIFLWHGSGGERWHSILRTGLKNATGTTLMQNGAALGPGIYFARGSGTSWGYVRNAQNQYARSALGAVLQVIALCEIANIRENTEFTLLRGTAPAR